jgi:CubicO group peptidase (beta-lactamase class C family)
VTGLAVRRFGPRRHGGSGPAIRPSAAAPTVARGAADRQGLTSQVARTFQHSGGDAAQTDGLKAPGDQGGSMKHMDRRAFLRTAAATSGAALAADAVLTQPAVAASAKSVKSGGGGHVRAAVRAVDALVPRLMRRTGVPGVAVGIVQGDEVLYAKGFGVRTVGQPGQVTPQTVFQLASVSKAVGSTVIARQVSDRVVSWTDPVAPRFPAFVLADPYVTEHATIADLYAHRSGLPDHAGDMLEDLGFTREQIFERLRYYPLEPFRASWAYTNYALTAAAESVAAASRLSWADLSERALYGPLGMRSTSSRFADFLKATNRASTHVRENGRWAAKYLLDTDPASPAAGVSSNVADMTRWLRLQLGGGKFNGRRLISEQALLPTRSPISPIGPPPSLTARSTFYGLGLFVYYDDHARLHVEHAGQFQGLSTLVSLTPDLNLGVVILTNARPVGLSEAVAATLFDVAATGRVSTNWFDQVYAPGYAGSLNSSELEGKKRPSHPAPALPASAYAGTYASQLYGPAVVASGPNGLTLSLGPKPLAYPLTHWDGNRFSYMPTGESALGIAAVTFRPGASGTIDSVNVENLNGSTEITSELGTFTRTG